MNKPKVLIFGSSGHAKVIIDIFEKENMYEIIGLLDSYRSIGEKTLGYPVIGTYNTIPKEILALKNLSLFIAIGDNWERQQVFKKIINLIPNAEFVNAIHPSSQIGKNVTIGKGVSLMAGSIVNSDSLIGDFTILNTNASLGHDSKMSDFSSLGSRAVTGGHVMIGDFSAISIGATLVNKLSIGKHSIIGAGSLLMKDCGDNKIMYGVPAKIIRNHPKGEKYMR